MCDTVCNVKLGTHRRLACTPLEQVGERRVAGLICLISIFAPTVPHLQATVLHRLQVARTEHCGDLPEQRCDVFLELQTSTRGLNLVTVAHESANLAAEKVNHCCRRAGFHSKQNRWPACCQHQQSEYRLVNCCSCALAANTRQRAELVSRPGDARRTQRHLDSFFRACGYLLSSRPSTAVRPLQMTSSSTVCPGGYSSVCKEAVCKGTKLRFRHGRRGAMLCYPTMQTHPMTLQLTKIVASCSGASWCHWGLRGLVLCSCRSSFSEPNSTATRQYNIMTVCGVAASGHERFTLRRTVSCSAPCCFSAKVVSSMSALQVC